MLMASLTVSHTEPVTVSYATAESTGTADRDYTPSQRHACLCAW